MAATGENCSTHNESMQTLMELSYLCSFPMAAKAAILLKVPDILSTVSTPLTAKQIADRIPGDATSEAKLERLLQALTTYGLFAVSGSKPRAYGLTAMSRLLVKDDNGLSLSSMFLLNTEASHLETLQQLHEAVLDDGVVPFEKAYGQPLFHYFAQNNEMGEIFHSTMSNLSALSMTSILKNYVGFKDVKVLVDVGGGSGLNCRMIKAAYPHISAINFDMPFVVAKAPKMPGIEHHGGSMFEFVPNGGDAILIKNVLHNWDDERCVMVLRNCHSAMPGHGKIIIIEILLPEEIDMSLQSRLAVSFDLAMMTGFKGGKERTARQFKALIESAGFKNFKVALNQDMLFVMEAYKVYREKNVLLLD